MTTARTLSKEAFFREALVPTGTVTEVLVGLLTSRRSRNRENEAIGVAVWEPLNYAAHYVLSTNADVNLAPLIAAILQYRACIIGMLRDMTVPKSLTARNRVRYDSVSIPKSLKAPTEQIFSAIGLDKDTNRAKWVEAHHNALVPKELTFISKWRTFSRNLEPEKALMDTNLPQYAEAAKKLRSHGGQQKAEKLWQACFGGPASGVMGRTTQAAIPDYVEVEVLKSRFMAVSVVFYPQAHIKVASDIAPKLPKDLIERLAKQQKALECSYTALPGAVQECVNWLEEQKRMLPELQAGYDEAVADLKANDIVDKLKSQFTPDEIAVLRKRLA
jgi:hypothetical protein